MKNINKEMLSLILIITSGTIILGLAALLVYGFHAFITMEHSGLYISVYVLVSLFFYFLEKRLKHPATKAICQILFFPVKLFKSFITVSAPYLVLQTHLLMYLLFACIIPLGFYFLDKVSSFINLTHTTHIYIIVTFSVVIATMANSQIKQLIYLLSPYRISQLQKLKKIDFKELTDYLMSENNIKFIIYFSYFLYLLVFNFFNFQQHSFYSNAETDKAVLQSFITFIALERLITNLNDLDFKPSEMVKRLLNSMTGNVEKRKE